MGERAGRATKGALKATNWTFARAGQVAGWTILAALGWEAVRDNADRVARVIDEQVDALLRVLGL